MNVDETRRLRGAAKKPRGPLRNSERVWVQWPARIWSSSGMGAMREMLFNTYVNTLLVFVPLGIVAGALQWNPAAVFILNFLAILPFATILNFATNELCLHAGTFGEVLNGVFARPIDLIIGIVALSNGQVRLVQSSMLGSVLFNILLVLGSSFIIGGIFRREQLFNSTVTSTMSSLMTIATATLVLPAAFSASVSHSKDHGKHILFLSHGTAIVLLLLYAFYLFFALRTHRYLFQDGEAHEAHEAHDPVQSESRTLGPLAAFLTVCIVSTMAGFCCFFVLGSIPSIVEATNISQSFFGIILIPVMGNAVQHWNTGMAASRDKMDLVISLAIGNSLQIALFITPVLVILGWIIGQPMSFNFSDFEAIMSFVSVSVVILIIQDGKSNYLEGFMCVGIYLIIALAVCFLPDDGSGLGAFMAHHIQRSS